MSASLASAVIPTEVSGLALTVALCTHNPRRDYLDQTIAGLQSQTLNTASWEFLLVDNASTQGSVKANDWSWHPSGSLLLEPKLGLTHARLRAMSTAKAELMVFVDDDNLLTPDYLEQVLEIAHAWPLLGVFGGAIEPEFDIPPPDWTRPYWQFLAIREVDQARWSNQVTTPDMVPYGAGFCLRRSIWETYLSKVVNDPVRLALGRTGSSLASAEDVDIWYEALSLGMGAGLFPQLRLKHLIPPGRLQPDYLLRLVESNQYCLRLLAHVRRLIPESETKGRPTWRRWLNCLRQEFQLLHQPPFERSFRRAWGRGLDRADRDAMRLLGDVSPKVKSQAHIQADSAL